MGLFKNTFYIRISNKLITVRLIEDIKEYSDMPLLAHDGKRRFVDGWLNVIAIGQKANRYKAMNDHNIKVENAFENDLNIKGKHEFEIARQTLRQFMRKIEDRKSILRPIVILHPTDIQQNDITEREMHVLGDLGYSIGARKVFIWIGRQLTDYEIQNNLYSSIDGKIYEID